jgi:hypothetical protein
MSTRTKISLRNASLLENIREVSMNQGSFRKLVFGDGFPAPLLHRKEANTAACEFTLLVPCNMAFPKSRR